MRLIDPDAVYQKALTGSADSGGLDELELLVYAVKEIETYIAMAGWEGFFIGSCANLYDDVRRCLELSQDSRSLAILDSFAQFLASKRIALEPDAIEGWLAADPGTDLSERPNWGEMFQAATAERWQRIGSYLRACGVELVSFTPASTLDDEIGRFADDLATLIKGGTVKPKAER